jgi:Nuclease-related domain
MRSWLVLGLVIAIAVITTLVVGLVLGTDAFWLGFIIGVGGTGAACYAVWLATETTGARSWLVGSNAEVWTGEELNRLGNDWRRVDCVPFGQIFDVDHLVVGPAGVFAVETKFTAVPWRADGPSFELRRAVRNAEWKARKIRLMLKAAGNPGTTPVLVIWGPGAPDIDGGSALFDGVLVCEGRKAAEWRKALADGPAALSMSECLELLALVEDHVARTEAAYA